jgi:Flp pilus assembly protein TadG
MERSCTTVRRGEGGECPSPWMKRSARRGERGTILVLTGILVTVLIGALALAIDLGYVFSIRNQLQNAVDAAALAGASGLRSTIESGANQPHQEQVVKQLAVLYASYNQVRRSANTQAGSTPADPNRLVLDPGQVSFTGTAEQPQVRIEVNMPSSFLFAGLLGFAPPTIQSVAVAATFPVDGGTGGLGGCWRPLLLPDTFFQAGDVVRYVGDPARPTDPLPNQPGDYYRSRYAAGGRNGPPFVDSAGGGIGAWVTGIRDTTEMLDVGVRTVMGQPVTLQRDYYRIPDLTGRPRVTFSELPTGVLANFGYCGEIRVGEILPVFPVADGNTYQQVQEGLTALRYRTNDVIDLTAWNQYRYLKSPSYPAPNSHAGIIPVLLFNPLELVRNPLAAQLQVTNIGLFYLQEVRSDGALQGTFVRELFVGALPISPAHLEGDSGTQFRRSWLPVATQLQQ